MSLWHSLREYPAFRTLFGTTLATNSGFWMWIIASGWLALLLTDSPFFVGLVGFVGGIPTLIFGIFVGAIIDRFSRRNVLLVAQAVVSVIVVTMAVFLFLDILQPWQLLVGAFINGTCMSVIFPTRNAMVANLVPGHHLANAVALNAAGQNATRVVGPAMAGPMIALIGVGGTFAICAALQVIAFVVTSRLPAQVAADGASGGSILSSVGVGLSTVWRSEYLLGMIILAGVPTMFLMPYINLMPVFARDVLGLGSTGLGILMAANGFGAVLGSLYVAASRRLTENPSVLIGTGLGFAVVLILFALTPITFVGILLILVAGFISAVFLAVNNTLIQLHVDDAVRGRVLGIYVLTWGLLPVGTLPAGAIADAAGAPIALIVMSIVAMAVMIFVAIRFPAVRRAAPTRGQAVATPIVERAR
ncbi:MAG: MFS transporter [Sphaerobacteraceae bacterium]|nr:MAG: MFS transporter [Sphaerobacteraceae bacterium]